jgi:hypothetical protein
MVLSLKAWKSRSLPGLQRTERFTISSRRVRPKKPPRETAGVFCLSGILVVIVRQRDVAKSRVPMTGSGGRSSSHGRIGIYCGIVAGWTPLLSSACLPLRRCWSATLWRTAVLGLFWRSPEHALWAPFMASCKAHGHSGLSRRFGRALPAIAGGGFAMAETRTVTMMPACAWRDITGVRARSCANTPAMSPSPRPRVVCDSA